MITLLLLLSGVQASEIRLADIHAEATLSAPAEAIRDQLVDLHRLQAAFPEDCASRWEHGEASVGQGATARLTYHAAGMHRRLDATVAVVEPHRVELSHAGNRGFVTRFLLEPEGEQTRVGMTTYLNPPPWPFGRYFYRRVKPAWEACHARVLQGLEAGAKEQP